MGLEGLQAILDKEEIVSTPLANDLLDQPARIEDLYRRHVRTYIPLGRQATGNEQGPSVADFERQVIRDVREGGATRGYLTGEYGYGKTSTALYLWERARAENLLAVPPFKLPSLEDLVIASYGWVRYELGRTRPDLLPKARALYDSVIDRSAEAFATRYRMSLADAQRMLQEQPDVLRLTTQDYIRFIEALTQLAQEAGFAGLLILADELQQYIEPAAQLGQRDPISALFDLVEAIRSRRGQLPFGLVLIIPPKDLSLLRDQRGDLVHRILQVSLDLGTIYDRWFPQRLWQRLAATFAFEDHRDRIISTECLDALGQIASRGDLSDGPRTVINAIRRATQRYIAAGHPEDAPYTPERLIEDFLNGAITFDSARRIPHITGQALAHSMVKGYPLREQAIKWAAAFPQEGLPRTLQESLGLTEAIDELAHSVLNDLLIEVGDRRSGGLTLRGLDHVGVQTDWLTTAIREFWRGFDQDQEQPQLWVIEAFLTLLTTKIFPSNQWAVIERSAGGLFASAGMTLDGCFSNSRQRFPDRRILVQVLWQDEPDLGNGSSEEIVVLFRIHAVTDVSTQVNNQSALQIDVNARRIEVSLNVMRRDDRLSSPQIDQFVRPAILSTHLTPRLLLALYQFLDEKRVNNLIPKEDQQFVQYAFQAALLDTAFQLMFHPGLDESRSVGQERIIEVALISLLEQLFPTYVTLICTTQWGSSLQKYTNVLKYRESMYERQGKLPIEGTKREIAEIFALSDTGLDNFMENFGALITVDRPFPTRQTARAGAKGAVRLTLHPLERTVMDWLHGLPHEEMVSPVGSKLLLRGLSLVEIRLRAAKLGYLRQEIDSGIRLLAERQLVEHDMRRDMLYEKAPIAPSLDELGHELMAWQSDLTTLEQAFPASAQIPQWKKEADALRRELHEQLRARPDDERALAIKSHVLSSRQLLAAFAEEQQQQLQEKARRLLALLPSFDRHLVSLLDTTVRGPLVFFEVLNSLRIEALNRYEAIDDALNTIRGQLETAQRSLQSEPPLLTVLARNAVELGRSDQAVDTVREQHSQLVAQSEVFEGWLNLASQAAQTAGELTGLRDEASKYQSRFNQWVRDVNSSLTDQTYITLSQPTEIQQTLRVLQELMQQVAAAAAQRFADLQTGYRQAIEGGLGLSDAALWPLHQYNSQATGEGDTQLLADVRATMQHSCERLGVVIHQALADIRSTLKSSQLATLSSDERQRLHEQGTQIEAELKALSRKLMDYEGQTEDLATLRDLPKEGGGRFRNLTQDLGRLKIRTEHIQPEVQSLQQVLQSLQLTSAEELLFAALSTGESLIEIANLRQIVTGLIDADFWNALQGLYAKRRIRLRCERISSE